MKKLLQIASLLIVVASFVTWVLHGANTGWTTTETRIMHLDEVTGIEYPEYISQLTFGIELPVVGTTAGLILMAISLFIRKSKKSS